MLARPARRSPSPSDFILATVKDTVLSQSKFYLSVLLLCWLWKHSWPHTTARGPTSNLWLHNRILAHLDASHVGGGGPFSRPPVFTLIFSHSIGDVHRLSGDATLSVRPSVFVLSFRHKCASRKLASNQSWWKSLLWPNPICTLNERSCLVSSKPWYRSRRILCNARKKLSVRNLVDLFGRRWWYCVLTHSILTSVQSFSF